MGEGGVNFFCDLGKGDLVFLDLGVKGDDGNLLALGKGDFEEVLLDSLGDPGDAGDLGLLPFGDSDDRNLDLK